MDSFLAARQVGETGRVVGIDMTQAMLAKARRAAAELGTGNVEFVEAEAERLPFDDASFDRVTCIGSLEHFPDPRAGAAEMARVLRPNGKALVFVPNLFFLGHIWFGVRHGTQPSEGGQAFSEVFLSSEGWTTLLTEAGLEVQSFHDWNFIFASEKVGPVVKRAWNALSRFVPRHAAYAFAFVCVPRA
jgi:SAM-dependent methyltransferase